MIRVRTENLRFVDTKTRDGLSKETKVWGWGSEVTGTGLEVRPTFTFLTFTESRRELDY